MKTRSLGPRRAVRDIVGRKALNVNFVKLTRYLMTLVNRRRNRDRRTRSLNLGVVACVHSQTGRFDRRCRRGCSVLTAPTRNLDNGFAGGSHGRFNVVPKIASHSCCAGDGRMPICCGYATLGGTGVRTPCRGLAHNNRVFCMRVSNSTARGPTIVSDMMSVVSGCGVNCNSMGRGHGHYLSYKCRGTSTGLRMYPGYNDRRVSGLRHVANCLIKAASH